MREEKYANVLLEDEDREVLSRFNNDSIDDSRENKLSMTRELKFRDIQKKVEEDIDVNEGLLHEELTDDYDLTDTWERKIISRRFETIADAMDDKGKTIQDRDDKEELIMPKEVGTKRIVGAYNLKKGEDGKSDEKMGDTGVKVKKIEKMGDGYDDEDEEDRLAARKIGEDDIYLTTAFKPLSKRFNLGKFILRMIIMLGVIGGIGALAYFVLYPVYKLYVNSKPHMIYNNTIDYVADEINKMVDVLYSNDSFYREIGLKYDFDEEIDGLVNLEDYTFGVYTDIDSTSKMAEYGYYVMKQERVGYRVIQDNNKKYINLIGSDIYLEGDKGYKEENSNDFYDDYEKYLDIFKNLKTDDVKYLINGLRDVLKRSLENEKIVAQKDSIIVNDEEIGVVRNSLRLDKEVKTRIQQNIIDGLLEDSKLCSVLEIVFETNSSSLRGELDEFLTDNDGNDEVINVYTRKGVEVVGFDIQVDGFRRVYWYVNNDGDFEGYIDLTDSSCKDSDNCSKTEDKIISVIGIKNTDDMEVKIKENGTEVGDLQIRTLKDGMIDVDFNVLVDEDNVRGTLLAKRNDDKIDGEVSLESLNMRLKISFFVKMTGEKISSDIGNKVLYTDEGVREEFDRYNEVITKGEDMDYLDYWMMRVDDVVNDWWIFKII